MCRRRTGKLEGANGWGWGGGGLSCKTPTQAVSLEFEFCRCPVDVQLTGVRQEVDLHLGIGTFMFHVDE